MSSLADGTSGKPSEPVIVGQSNMDSNNVILRATGVKKSYGSVKVLTDVNFDLRQGEVHALIGDNGAGKSTFIKILSGVVCLDGGSIELYGQLANFISPHDAQDAGIETVYQDLALALTLDASENVYLGRELLRKGLLGRMGFLDRQLMHDRTAVAMKGMGITLKSVSAPVSALSGGQRQGVAVVRAAMWERKILIMDEPTAALGQKQTAEVRNMIKRSRDELGISIILISHSLPFVFEVADRITVMRHGRSILRCAASEASTDQLIGAMTGSSAEVPPRSVFRMGTE